YSGRGVRCDLVADRLSVGTLLGEELSIGYLCI
ncbi:hypothetical protein A2U01_0088858, partial [Trifolium medium]|nr:hypothetical protein [Trifolium medium]